jgi:tetratricopeptide (TPR) repeat protein
LRPANPNPRSRYQALVAALAVFAATLAAYIPALEGGPLWDDAAHITAPRLQTWGGLWRIWSRIGETQQYYPVLHSAFWLEHRIWGDSAFGYHLLNVALHAAAACLFAVVLVRIRPDEGGWPWPAWLAGAAFALHPVCAESVAWISEQKNTLSLTFYLLSVLAYLRFDRERRWGWYLLAFVLFVLALLSKSVTATLPAALLLLVALQRRDFSFRRDVGPLLPWFATGICSGLLTAWVERNVIGARGEAFDLGLVERFFLAGRIVWFYLGKLLWPENLIFIYPRWHVTAGLSWSVGCLAVAAVVAALWAIRTWSRAPLIAFLFFIGTLFPALGFFNVYPFVFSFVADHFQYIASLGVIALVIAGGASVAREQLRQLDGAIGVLARLGLAAAAVAVLAALFALTWRQTAHYRNAGALYEDTLARNPECWMAENNLGVYLMDQGSLDAATGHLRRAVLLRPDYSDAHNNLGNALSKSPGHAAEAITEFETALRLEPGMTQAHANLGLALVNVPGRRAEGIEELETALRGRAGDPAYAQVHADLGAALAADPGRTAQAVAEFEEALRLKPRNEARIRDSLGIALGRAGRAAEAVDQFAGAVALTPGAAEYHNDLGVALMVLGRRPEAVAQFREAVRLQPDLVAYRYHLGVLLSAEGMLDEAIAQLRRVLELAPASRDAHFSLGLALRKAGREEEAAAEFAASGRKEP